MKKFRIYFVIAVGILIASVILIKHSIDVKLHRIEQDYYEETVKIYEALGSNSDLMM